VPPFQLMAMTFAIGAAAAFASWPFRRVEVRRLVRLPPTAWLIGVGGLFGYHFLYYTALRNAPVAEASLIAYLWPMLIVAGSALLPNGGLRWGGLRWHHLAGCMFGFAGAALLVSGGGGFEGRGSALGFASAFGCALVWSSYSILSRTQAKTPTDAVALFCLATAILAVPCHLLLEATQWPESSGQWLAVLALGLLPVGMAFFAWDYGVKHGDIRLLGVGAYFAPLLSTVALVAFGLAPATGRIGLACLLIVTGALVAARPWQMRRQNSRQIGNEA
jgi:drug/metabolite transporter (DMT)-like permease